MPTVIRRDESRQTETPNAIMTTFASPSLGSTADLSLWQVEMSAGQRGPVHRFDSEQLWTVLSGVLALTADGETTVLQAGDTVVLERGVERQITADAALRAIVCGRGDTVVHVPGEPAPRPTPPWIA